MRFNIKLIINDNPHLIEYYHYVAELECGIPGVRMMGPERDWQNLVNKLNKVQKFLAPIDDVLKLGEWFNSTRVVLGNLLDTYQEKDTTEWWSKIFDIQKSYGSGGGKWWW